MTSTVTIPQLLQRFYDEIFLEVAKKTLVFDQFGQKRPLPKYKGTIIQFQRYKKLGKAKTPLTEGVNPSGSNISAENVSAQVKEYGDFLKTSSLVNLTAMDKGLVGKVKLLGMQMEETLDSLMGDEICVNGAEQIVSTASAVSDITATDVMTMKDLKIGVRALKNANAMKFEGGYFVLILDPDVEYDFTNDSLWIDSAKYSDTTRLYKGEIGKWFGVRCVVGTQPYRTLTDGTYDDNGSVHNNVLIAKNAYGITELEGYGQKIILKQSGDKDTSNPLNMYATAGWKQAFTTKVLNSTWIRNIKTGASS